MKSSLESFRTVFSKNRTEELGADVYKHFVVPRFYDQLDLLTARKPRLLIGGRGCGKTMLLRYLSYESSFSIHRTSIPEDAIEHLGLYWRIDTQFAAVMNKRGLPQDVWSSAFNHFLALLLSAEIVRCVEKIAVSTCPVVKPNDLASLSFDRLALFDNGFGGNAVTFSRTLQDRLWIFESWVANVRKVSEPVFLPGVLFLQALISHLKDSILALGAANFFVYVDEFENLLDYQQRILNTCIKHSETPLIFNIAMKRHGFQTKSTVGPEAIQNIADYREYDLEEYLLDSNFPVFSAEVLSLNLSNAGVGDVPIDVNGLQNPETLATRKAKDYIDIVSPWIKTLFPGLSHDGLAAAVFSNETLVRKLQDRISAALKERGGTKPITSFFRPEFPQASIVVAALLHRRRLTFDDIEKEMNLLAAGKPNKFTGAQGWIHNNFIGCLLWLYESHSSFCPLFSGFEVFCLLARGNLRHFLELCHVSLNQMSEAQILALTPVPPVLQAKAARQASTTFINEIPAFGRYGDRLHTFVFRLGSLFALAHRRPSQSEPEQSHFAVTSGSSRIKDETTEFLNEAEKWSVIYREEETKVKDNVKVISFDYILNPIYSPYFNITYRKKRKVELTQGDLETLIHGSFNDANELLRRFSRSWGVDDTTGGTLFFRFAEETEK